MDKIAVLLQDWVEYWYSFDDLQKCFGNVKVLTLPHPKKKSKSTLAPVSPIVHCGNQTVGHRNYYTKSKLGEISLLQGLRSP